MSWQDDREKLLADTIGFVQHALGESLVLAVKKKVPMSPEIATAAREFRRYHTEPGPRQLARLRLDLHALSEALDHVQRTLRVGQPARTSPASA